jgi:hypothetical protein
MDSTYIVASLLVGSLLGGLILWPLAKFIGRIQKAGYVNSFLVCLISSIMYLAVGYLILKGSGEDVLKIGFSGLLIINVLLLSVSYITVGKFVWKASWFQSFKANIIWIIIYSTLLGYLLNSISN